MHRIHPQTGETLVPYRFPDGTFGAADPALGNKKHHSANRISVESETRLRDLMLQGYPIWMAIQGTRDRRLISKGIVDAPPPLEGGEHQKVAEEVTASGFPTPPKTAVERTPVETMSSGTSRNDKPLNEVDVERLIEAVGKMSTSALERECERPELLFLGRDTTRTGKVIVNAYAPFDYINHDARIVIVGITPGKQQMREALTAANGCWKDGKPTDEILKAAKVHASFAGVMRKNLVSMMDAIGVSDILNLHTTATLWGDDSHLANFTSAIRYPTFIDGENYTGRNPEIDRHPFLMSRAEEWLGPEILALQDAVILPMGGVVERVVRNVLLSAGRSDRMVIPGVPHASGANPDVHRFLGSAGEDHKVRQRFHIAARHVAELKADMERVL